MTRDIWFETSFDVPSRLADLLEGETVPCHARPVDWNATDSFVSCSEALRRFEAFHRVGVEAVKQAKRRAAGHLASLLRDGPDDIDAVFTATRLVMNGRTVGVVVSFAGRQATPSSFEILRIGPNAYLSRSIAGTQV